MPNAHCMPLSTKFSPNTETTVPPATELLAGSSECITGSETYVYEDPVGTHCCMFEDIESETAPVTPAGASGVTQRSTEASMNAAGTTTEPNMQLYVRADAKVPADEVTATGMSPDAGPEAGLTALTVASATNSNCTPSAV